MDLAGRAERQLTRGGAAALAGEGIYYLGGAAQQDLYFREWATGKVWMVMAYPEFLWPLGSGPFSLSGDGRSLLTVRVDA